MDTMAEIMSIKKRDDGTFSCEVIFDENEYLNLQGHTNGIVVFSDKASSLDASISQRGMNSSTKYFLIPKKLRKGVNFNNAVSCQKLDCEDKTLFVFAIHKAL